jgi:uncharacterized protein
MVRPDIRDTAGPTQVDALRAFDLFAFTRSGRTLFGELDLSHLPRMLAEVPADAPAPDAPLRWRAEGSVTREPGAEGEREACWLTLAVSGAVWLECQRCLTPYRQALDAKTRFLIAETEAEADAWPMEDDEADAIVGSRQFDLVELIEEELLLALPLVPKHTVCPAVHESLTSGADGSVSETPPDEVGAEQEAPRPNPFAALKSLERGPAADGAAGAGTRAKSDDKS